jgi:hypothetical protein
MLLEDKIGLFQSLIIDGVLSHLPDGDIM